MKQVICETLKINGNKSTVYAENGTLFLMFHTAAWPEGEKPQKTKGWKHAAKIGTWDGDELTINDVRSAYISDAIGTAIGAPVATVEPYVQTWTRGNKKEVPTPPATETPSDDTATTGSDATTEEPTATTDSDTATTGRPSAERPASTSANDVLGGLAAYLSAQIKVNNDELTTEIINKVMATVGPKIDEIAATKVNKMDVTTHRGTHHVEGKTHKDFARVLKLIELGLNVYLYGPAGTGKTTLARQIAEALGLPFYCMGAAATKYDYTGFVDAGGRPVETPLKKAARDGGVVLLDEIDGSMPEALLPINALRDRQPVEMAGEMIYPHKDFVMICAGNTIGTGATEEYNGRQQQDSAFLNGFAKVALNYDPAIELAMANNDHDIVSFVHDLRNAAKTCHVSLVVSPRDINRLAVINEAFPNDHVNTLATATFEGIEQDTLRTLFNNLSDKRNVWARALQTLIGRAA